MLQAVNQSHRAPLCPGISLEAGNRKLRRLLPTKEPATLENIQYILKVVINKSGFGDILSRFACWVIFVTNSIIIYSTRVRKNNAISSAVRHVEWTEEKDW